MAAGLGFKTFATGDVLSAGDVNGYLMQGVLVFASAAARNSAITSPQEGQFAYLKDTDVTTYYTGSAWTNLDTTGMVNPMTTTGDTIYASSGSTPARLGIGTTGQVLTVAGGLPSWATPSNGSMTSLATGSLASGAVTISSINQTYRSLRLVLQGVSVSSTGGVVIRVNGDSNTRYYNGSMNGSGGASFTQTFFYVSETNLSSTLFGCVIDFPEYATVMGRSGNYTFGSTTNYGGGLWVYNQTTAISSITMTDSVGSLDAGTYTLYGVK
jgi:hypothetical protein